MVRAIPVGVGALAADIFHAALERTTLDTLAAAMFAAGIADLFVLAVKPLIAYRTVGVAVIYGLPSIVVTPLVIHVGDVVTHD
jgi:uncharacterized protein (UPF0218 family)